MPRPPRPVRLVALDLDGTTLNPSHELSPATVAVIRAVAARGVRVVLASGRLGHSILPFAETLGLDGVHIGLNGGVSFDRQHHLRHRHTMTVAQLEFAHRVLEDEGLDAMVFGAGGIWATHITPDVEYILSYGEPPPRIYTRSRLDLIEDPIKVLTVLPSGPRDALLEARVAPDLHAIRTGPTFYEFLAPGVSKGSALAELMDDWGLEPDEVLAIGDSENDVSMLQTAGFAVAMGNAVDAVKAVADAVTETNANDGVARALTHYVLDMDGQ